ncbi:MAG: signal peptidase I [Clostridia bacterium]|nr:signal peptidase I [Clostridia bacterium]
MNNDINSSIENTVDSSVNSVPPVQVKTAQNIESSTFTSSIYEGLSVVITAIFLIALVFTFVFRLVGVKGSSMENTLYEGDWLIVSPYYSEPEYGDIIISTHELDTMGPIVKRVIATEGDEVNIDENGAVFVNGEKLSEPYIINDFRRRGNLTYPVIVPENHVMVLGDNRPVSADSRYDYVGFAPVDALLGKAQLRLSSDWNIYSNFNN